MNLDRKDIIHFNHEITRNHGLSVDQVVTRPVYDQLSIPWRVDNQMYDAKGHLSNFLFEETYLYLLEE